MPAVREAAVIRDRLSSAYVDVRERTCLELAGKRSTHGPRMCLDPQLKPVDVGDPGELVVGGSTVPRGFIDRFVPDPFAADVSRMVSTGRRTVRRGGRRTDGIEPVFSCTGTTRNAQTKT